MLCAQMNYWTRSLRQQYYVALSLRCQFYSNGSSRKGNGAGLSGNGCEKSLSLSSYSETYKKLDNLDFSTAAKILFSEPTKKKRFGFDFHLVPFFFACMPSLAAYLVAQYARYEIRKMEAEQEVKKKRLEEEEKAKALEEEADEEQKKAGTEREIQEVKDRLNKLEHTIREVVVDSKKAYSNSSGKTGDAAVAKENRELPASNDGSEPGISAERNHATKWGVSSPERVRASSKEDQ